MSAIRQDQVRLVHFDTRAQLRILLRCLFAFVLLWLGNNLCVHIFRNYQKVSGEHRGMPVDIKSVDPAIVKAESKQERIRPKVEIPVFNFLVHTVKKTDDGFSPSVGEDVIVVHTSDDKYCTVLRAVASKTPLQIVDGVSEFPFSAEALTTIVHWCDKNGIDGKGDTSFSLPVTHTDFAILLTSDWEKQFFANVVARHDGVDVYVSSINAAERYHVAGLLDFLIVALGCAIRGKSDTDILSVLHENASVTDEEVAAAKTQYPWFAAVTASVKA